MTIKSKWTRLKEILYLRQLRKRQGEPDVPFVSPPTNPPYVNPLPPIP